MNTEKFERKLSAILSADVKGYSRLMRADEDETIRTVTAYRTAIAKLVEQYRGRVVDSPGDNVMAEFGSGVDAVNCAVEIQRELAERNEELPAERKMEFRIGVNSGDVIQEGERIYGDGVNIAARVEGLAEGGGICISGTVYDSIEGKLGLEFENLGEHEVKNIDKPIRLFRVISLSGAASHRSVKRASVEKMALPLPDKPSIAVLPFENLSGDPAQDHVVDGMTEAIITGLSKTPELFVIARNSVFTYKGKPVKVKQVSEDLGVKYVLEGSVQKAGDRLRINAQLIDAIEGHHLWAEKYDRDLKDLFALQDDITMKVITELQVKLTEGEYARVLSKGTKNFEAYLKCLNAIQLERSGIEENHHKSRKMFEEITALDPNYPRPIIMLGWTHFQSAAYFGSKSPKEDLARAEEFARKALELDDSLGMPHGLLAEIYAVRKQWDKALAEAELAVSKDPNTLTMRCLAVTLTRVGRHEESVALWEKILRLNPYPSPFFLNESGIAYFQAGQYEDALAQGTRLLERARKGEFDLGTAHRLLAGTYAMLDHDEKARNHVAETLKIDPKTSCKRWAQFWLSLWKYQNDVDHFVNALRKAGLPE